jgi:hypothetical protein
MSSGGDSALYLVHSADGVSVSVVDVNELVKGHDLGQLPAAGVSVTADAITLRFTEPTGEDPGQYPTKVPAQVLVVGTPR